jgi:capsular exopolysaccharide synthesis family protein
VSNQKRYPLVTCKYPKSSVAEAFRTLRTNLGFAELDHPFHSMVVTSAGPEDGKSTIASNLGVVMAHAGHRAIIVDCDLRRPMQHKIFELENIRGLTTALIQKLKINEVIQRGVIENLDVLTTGPIPPNPAELIGTEPVRRLWAELSAQYDYVIVDSPPLLAVTDAALLASQVDGVLLVVEPSTRIEMAVQAKEQLIRANARIVGVVMNRVKIRAHDYRYYYYYHQQESEVAADSIKNFQYKEGLGISL